MGCSGKSQLSQEDGREWLCWTGEECIEVPGEKGSGLIFRWKGLEWQECVNVFCLFLNLPPDSGLPVGHAVSPLFTSHLGCGRANWPCRLPSRVGKWSSALSTFASANWMYSSLSIHSWGRCVLSIITKSSDVLFSLRLLLSLISSQPHSWPHYRTGSDSKILFFGRWIRKEC